MIAEPTFNGREIRTSITINATPKMVWAVLTNFAAYPEWNPFITQLTGTPAIGNTIEAHIQPPGASAMKFTPTVLGFEPEKEFRWLGKLLVRGLMDGEHRFFLIENTDGTTTFEHGERFSGLLVPFLRKMLAGPTVQGFVAMNNALATRCEALHTHQLQAEQTR